MEKMFGNIKQLFYFTSLLLFKIKAAIRTVNPKEDKYMQPEPKFKISVSMYVTGSIKI